jgi:hypothetical protein
LVNEIAVALAVLVVAVVVALVTRVILREDSVCDSAPGRRRSPCPPLLRGEVLFATPESRRTIRLDCLVENMGGAGPRIPLQIRCSGPHLRLVGVSLGEVVLHWLSDGRRVFIEAVRVPDRPRGQLTLRTEKGKVVLDLDDDSDVHRRDRALRPGHLA